MAIRIDKLGPGDVGRWVEYRSGGPGRQKTERGRIKAWNRRDVFVVYQCNHEWDRFKDFTAQATDPDCLTFVDGPSNAETPH